MPNHYLGIDLHKKSSVWVLLNKNREVIWERNVPVSPDNIKSTINSCPIPVSDVSGVVEPVCGWRWVSDLLETSGVDMHIANPFKVKLIAESRLKHDRIDAKILAELLRADFLPESYWASDDIFKLRELIRHRAYLVSCRTGFKNRIHGIFNRNAPTSKTFNALRARSKEEVENLMTDELRNLFHLLKEFDQVIKPLDQMITKLAKKNETANLLMTMPGVGPITALAVVAEVGDFKRFVSANHLACFAGLVPRQRSSGESVRFGKITKSGSKILRYMLVEAALRIHEDDDDQLSIFLRRLKERLSAKQARVALARKMLTTMWYLIKKQTPYHSLISRDSNMKPVIS